MDAPNHIKSVFVHDAPDMGAYSPALPCASWVLFPSQDLCEAPSSVATDHGSAAASRSTSGLDAISLSLLPVIAFGAETLHRLRPEGQSTVPASAHVARPIGQQKESKEYAVYVVVKLRRRLAEFIPSPIKETLQLV